jgi:hypothetical protein
MPDYNPGGIAFLLIVGTFVMELLQCMGVLPQ